MQNIKTIQALNLKTINFKTVNFKTLGLITAASLFVLSGCATQAPSSTQSAPAEKVSIIPSDDSSPTMPSMAVASVIEPVIDVPKEPEPEPEIGSVASVLKKMESSPYTLYWRGKNTYSYYVGGLFDAEYEPGVGLVVKDDAPGDVAITCKYDDGGALNGATNADSGQKLKKACSELMYTLDSELSD